MRMAFLTIALIISSGLMLSCKHTEGEPPIIVHVVRDPSARFADQLRRATRWFDAKHVRLGNGKDIIIATNEGGSFSELLSRVPDMKPDVVILSSDGAAEHEYGSQAVIVCGEQRAYIPAWVSGAQRAASQEYVTFLSANCTN
jgi:hypothetical protein